MKSILHISTFDKVFLTIIHYCILAQLKIKIPNIVNLFGCLYFAAKTNFKSLSEKNFTSIIEAYLKYQGPKHYFIYNLSMYFYEGLSQADFLLDINRAFAFYRTFPCRKCTKGFAVVFFRSDFTIHNHKKQEILLPFWREIANFCSF